jgi:hypothetical protein
MEDVRADRSFMKDLSLIDKRLGCKFNGNHFVITYDRGHGEPVNILRVKHEDGGFRQPDRRDLEILRQGDLASGENMNTRLSKLAYASYTIREDMKRKNKENIRNITKDDKHFLMNKIGRIIGQGKPRPAFRQVTPKNPKNVMVQ